MAKKKMKRDEQAEKKSRAKFQQPEKLTPFIKNARRVPAGVVLLDAPETFKINRKIYRTEDDEDWIEKDGYSQALKKTVDDCLAELPADFCQYIKDKGERNLAVHQGQFTPEMLYIQTLKEYQEFRQSREDLKAYAAYFTNWRKHGVITGGIGGAYGAGGVPIRLPSPQAAFQKENTKEGTVTRVVPFGLGEALDNVIGERVRGCEICQHIFWANRDDAKTCSLRCANTLRVRNSRSLTDEEKAEKKAQREANGRRNKQLKQLKENKNGTL